MSREVKCAKCGRKQNYEHMSRCYDCKKYYCDDCIEWNLADESYGFNQKYHTNCPKCNRSLGPKWKDRSNEFDD